MATIKVTEKQIPINYGLYTKVLLMCKRLTQKKPKWDCVFNIDGMEGVGKTTLSILIGYIVAKETGRPFSEKNMFFNVDEGIKFAQNTEEQIIIFDEPSNDALGIEFRNKTQIKLMKLLMQVRKKRHLIIFNLTKFYKFAEYIVVDRPNAGMFHVFISNQSNRQEVMFSFIPSPALQVLYNDYRFKKLRNYAKYTQFVGRFPDILDGERPYNILDEFDIEDYERRKDKGIQEIGVKKSAKELKHDKLRLKIGELANKYPDLDLKIMAKHFDVSLRTLQRWKSQELDNDDTDENT